MMTIPTLDGLTIDEKRALAATLAYELQQDSSDFPADEQDFWEAIVAAMSNRVLSSPPLAIFVKSFGRAKFRHSTKLAVDWVNASCDSKPDRLMRQQLFLVAMRALVSHLEVRELPVTPTVLLNSMMVMPDAVDRRWPGYAKARLLDKIVTMAVAA